MDYKLLQHTKTQLFLDDDSQHSGSISVASNKTILELIDKDVQQKQLEMDAEKFSVGKFHNKMKMQEILEEKSEAHSDMEELTDFEEQSSHESDAKSAHSVAKSVHSVAKSGHESDTKSGYESDAKSAHSIAKSGNESDAESAHSVHSVSKCGHESDGNSVHSDAKSAKTCQVDSEYTRKYNKLEITVSDFLAVTFGQRLLPAEVSNFHHLYITFSSHFHNIFVTFS